MPRRSLVLIAALSAACARPLPPPPESTPLDIDGDGVPASLDCNDRDAMVQPNATEHCDGVDEDCNGLVDDDAVDAITYFRDADGDGHGDPTAARVACEPPPGHVASDLDCDDADPSVVPVLWWQDLDGDSHGDPDHALLTCDPPTGFVDDDADCDDADPEVPPTWFLDGDGDGWGRTGTDIASCEAPQRHTLRDGDCDDHDARVFPGAGEVPYDGRDDDCDGLDLVDVDGDGHAGGSGDDCNDQDPSISPSAPEVCGDGIDQDCDGQAPRCAPSGSVPAAHAWAVVLGGEPGAAAGTTLTAVDATGDGHVELLIGRPGALQGHGAVTAHRGIELAGGTATPWASILGTTTTPPEPASAPTAGGAIGTSVVAGQHGPRRHLILGRPEAQATTLTGHESVSLVTLPLTAGITDITNRPRVYSGTPWSGFGHVLATGRLGTTGSTTLFAASRDGVFGVVDWFHEATFTYGLRFVAAGGSAPPPGVVAHGVSAAAGRRYVALASGGDLSGDQRHDLAVGLVHPPNAPEVSVYTQLPTPLDTLSLAWPAQPTQVTTLMLPASADADAMALSMVPDLNGDGHDELLVGLPCGPGDACVDQSFLFLIPGHILQGGVLDLSRPGAWPAWVQSGRTGLGAAVAPAGDVNGDGHGDLVVGAPHADGGRGEAWVLYGPFPAGPRVIGSGSAPSARLVAPPSGGACGAAVLGAGDLDRDGFDEVAIACPERDVGLHVGAGEVRVYAGGL